VVAIKKSYPGHAKRVMFGVWSFLRQFMYTKIIIVVDDDIDARNWKDVIWALTTRSIRCATPRWSTTRRSIIWISPRRWRALGSKIGIDATNKWPGETSREWGRPIERDAATVAAVDKLWPSLGL
jgi:4-hydroxy-3-polyprenylbenzoate decarboxylase